MKLKCLWVGPISARLSRSSGLSQLSLLGPPWHAALTTDRSNAEGSGYLPAGRTSEIDPPTSKVIWVTVKLWRNWDIEVTSREESAGEPMAWRAASGASERQETAAPLCWGKHRSLGEESSLPKSHLSHDLMLWLSTCSNISLRFWK